MSSLKQVIFNALTKCATPDPSVPQVEYATAEDARDAFIKLVMLELFPEDVPTEPSSAVECPLTEAFVKLEIADVAPVEEKKKRAQMSEETKAAMKAKRDATLAAKRPAEEEAAPKKAKKVKPTEDSNLQKIDGTWRKHLKKAAGDKYSKEQETALLGYLNGLDKEEYKTKKAEEHVKAFLGESVPVVNDEKVDADLDVVEFGGKDYFVNPVTKRVYEGEGEYDEEVGWTSYTPVGYVGMAAFTDMKL